MNATTCAFCSASFEITDSDRALLAKLEVPEPTWCPACRRMRRLTYYNLRSLYNRKCSATGKRLISIYSEKPFTVPGGEWAFPAPVYDNRYWWGDSWDGLQYGQYYDFSRPFFIQFQELLMRVPRIAVMNDNEVKSDNCQYTNDFSNSRNCYLCFSGWYAEDCLYTSNINSGTHKNVVDSDGGEDNQFSYDTIDCKNCYQCVSSIECQNCSDVYFSYHCANCQNCIFSSNLVGKQYCILNKEYSKEEYLQYVAQYQSGSYTVFSWAKNYFLDLLSGIPRRAATMIGCENSVGNNLKNCKNVRDSYNYYDSVDCSHVLLGRKSKDCMDIDCTGDTELVYDSINPDECYRSAFLSTSWGCKFSYYLDSCFHSQYLFGCVGLKRKNHCILNKEFSEREYEELLPRIIAHMKSTGEWGQFFPIESSPFAYNETMAQQYFPMRREEILSRGWKYREEELPDFSGITKTIPSSELPDSVHDIPDDILNWAIQCPASGKLFKLQKTELDFYRKMGLPVPREHPEVRYHARLQLQHAPQLWPRRCSSCSAEVDSVYAPDRPEQIFCEPCFSKIVYGS